MNKENQGRFSTMSCTRIHLPVLLLLAMVLFSSCERVTSNVLNVDYRGDNEGLPADGRVTQEQHDLSQDHNIEMEVKAKGNNTLTIEDGVPMATLSNDNTIPLVGLGVGNLQHYLVPLLIASAEQGDKRIRLFDTAHSSDNEHLVAQGIIQGMDRYGNTAPPPNNNTVGKNNGEKDKKLVVHVITKVWYTHLGYERTKLSIKHSFEQLKEAFDHPLVDLRVHMMLHWPRCYDNIHFMNCEEDEDNLPEHIKKSGPPPLEDKKNAWKQSWRALEDIYQNERHLYPLESIGLSNFNYYDLIQLDTFAKIHPHVLQINVWSLLYDPHVVDYCETNNIHIQVYNAMSGIVANPDKAPKAYHHLQKIAAELTTQIEEENTEDSFGELEIEELSPAQVVLAWLIQHGVGVIPRTSRLSRLSENSAITLMQVPELNNLQVETVAHAVEAYLSGTDLEEDIHVSVTFHAPENKDIMIFWNGNDGKKVHVAYVAPGDRFEETTYPDHSYRLYDAQDIDIYVDYTVNAKLGEHKNVHVEL